jgi:hypothetical protein
MHWYTIVGGVMLMVVVAPCAAVVIFITWRMLVAPYCPLCKNRKNTYRIGIAGMCGDETCDIHGDIENLKVSHQGKVSYSGH